MMTPHIQVSAHVEGVHLRLKQAEIVLPAGMAKELAALIHAAADAHDPLGMPPLPQVVPKGEPL